MAHRGIGLGLLLVIAGVPTGVLGADVASRLAPTFGYGITLTRAERLSLVALALVACGRCQSTYGTDGPVLVIAVRAFAPPITFAVLTAVALALLESHGRRAGCGRRAPEGAQSALRPVIGPATVRWARMLPYVLRDPLLVLASRCAIGLPRAWSQPTTPSAFKQRWADP